MKQDTEKLERIKAAIYAKGFNLKAFAAHICVGYSTLMNALNGTQPLTQSLENHIMLALSRIPIEDYFLFQVVKNNQHEFMGFERLVTIHEPDEENIEAGLLLLLSYIEKQFRIRGSKLKWSVHTSYGQDE